MEQWCCFKCKEKMVEADIPATFLEVQRYLRGLRCPKCGAAYLTEKFVVEVVSKGEEQIESKME